MLLIGSSTITFELVPGVKPDGSIVSVGVRLGTSVGSGLFVEVTVGGIVLVGGARVNVGVAVRVGVRVKVRVGVRDGATVGPTE